MTTITCDLPDAAAVTTFVGGLPRGCVASATGEPNQVSVDLGANALARTLGPTHPLRTVPALVERLGGRWAVEDDVS